MSILFQQARAGDVELASRIVMAPLTRSRAVEGNAPNDLHVEYYRQRATAGLIVTEGTSPSPNGLGYARTPGIFTQGQIAGWKRVTEAVHAAGGKIFLQIMHVGRVAHPLNQPAGARILAPSAIAPKVEMWTDAQGMQPIPTPEAMTVEEIREAVAEFAQGAQNAKRAGFDGLELHAANGYLPNQFLSPNTNRRTDQYGGSVEKRARFTLEVYDALAAVWTAGRVGIRVSPGGSFNDMLDENPRSTYTWLAKQLTQRGAAYLHVVRPFPFAPAEAAFDVWAELRQAFTGTLIANGGLDPQAAEELIAAGGADLAAFGRPFIANPDLPARIRNGWPLAQPDASTFYTPGPKGYTDYAAFA